MARLYSSTSVDTTLTSTINAVATSAAVVDATALLSAIPISGGDTFTIAIDPDTQSEEICVITAVAGNTLTITRALAGTSAQEHVAGTTVRHVLTSLELTDFETVKSDHITATSTDTLTNKTINAANNTLTGVITASSTDTLTNKTLTSPVINGATIATSNTRLAGVDEKTANYTLVAGDSSKLISVNSASNLTITVSSGVFTAGDVIYLTRTGTGTVTIAASGTTLTSPDSKLKLRVRYSSAAIICTASNTFRVVGDLAA
jgi:hypothetical protein